jgi:hypothetical protein
MRLSKTYLPHIFHPLLTIYNCSLLNFCHVVHAGHILHNHKPFCRWNGLCFAWGGVFSIVVLESSIWWVGHYVHPPTQLRCSVLSNFDLTPIARQMAILSDAINLGGGRLATKNTDVPAVQFSQPCTSSPNNSLLPL